MELEQLFGKDCVTLQKYTDLRMSSMPKVDEFVIGEKTMEKILSLNFECQRCGGCCQYQSEKCSKLQKKENGRYACDIHESQDYSLTCFSYPIRLDELAIEGIGRKYVQRCNQQTGEKLKPTEKDYIWYELGCVTGAMMLVLHSSDPAIGMGTKNFAERALQVIERLHRTEAVPIAPPAAFLCSGVVAVTGEQVSSQMLFTEKECKEAMERFKRADFISFRRMCEQVIKTKK